MVERLNEEEFSEQEQEKEIRTKDQLEAFYSQGFRNCGVAYLRLILMAFVCFWKFGFPEPTGLFSAISGFAIPCFFILSGYFILPDDRRKRTEKTKRKIKRTFLCFGFMLIIYLAVNAVLFGPQQLAASFSPRNLFNALVLNLWPLSIGSNIWFIHAMLYAYAVIYLAEKLKLMRFYKAAMLLLLVFMLLSGEFAGLIHFNLAGYQYIPGNWLTRALPYILLGRFLREKESFFLRIAAWKYLAVWIVGAGLSLDEIVMLGRNGYLTYEGHMIGFGLMAAALCGLAISKPLGSENAFTSLVTHFDPVLSGIIYMLLDPLYYLIGLLAGSGNLEIFSRFGSLAALAASVLLAFLLKNTKLFKAFFS